MVRSLLLALSLSLAAPAGAAEPAAPFAPEWQPAPTWRAIVVHPGTAPDEIPVNGLTFVDRSTADAYAVEVHAHCTDAADCEQARLRAAAAQVPKPVGASSKAVQQWWWIVMHEACMPGAVFMKPPLAPRYPPHDQKRGQAKIGMVANPCGEVRDTWVLQSSGNREFDLNALRAVSRWRIDHGPERGAYPIEFRFE